MVLVKNWTFVQLFFLGKMGRENLFGNVLDIIIAFLDYVNINTNRSQICIFAKGLVHGFSQKWDICSTFLFRQNRPGTPIW